MSLQFFVDPGTTPQLIDGQTTLVLRASSWDDFGFGTTFSLSVATDSGETPIGNTKIARMGQESNGAYAVTLFTQLRPQFSELNPDEFSVGQDANFYLNLIEVLGTEEAAAVTVALRDLAAMTAIPDEVIEQRVTQRSLLRYVSLRTVVDQYHEILTGQTVPRSFSLTYRPSPGNADMGMSFEVDPQSVLPSNLHVIIGPNGMGKTTALRRMVQALDVTHPQYQPGYVEVSNTEQIAGLVSVSFSAFDIFPAQERAVRSQAEFRVTRVGLPLRLDDDEHAELSGEILETETVREHEPTPDDSEIQRIFWRRLMEGCLSDRPERLLAALRLLAEADQVLQSAGISEPEALRELDFVQLSSGHKIVLLTVCSLVRYCEARTLVLIDEPESHLHPPLLGAFARALSNLMSETNSLAIVATHSAVVLQEVPQACAWKVWSLDGSTVVGPPTIQTFGENLGVLTEEVFGLEMDKSGYHALLRSIANEFDDYRSAKEHLGNAIGEEAKVLLRTMISMKSS